MNVMRSPLVVTRVPWVFFALSCAALSPVPVAAQVTRLAPAGPVVEVVDPSERISGNAAAGVVLVQDGDTIGSDRLWAYLSEPVPAESQAAHQQHRRPLLRRGRLHDRVAAGRLGGARFAACSQFSFLEKNYKDPLSEIAALLGAADEPRFYPLRWGAPHRAAAAPPAAAEGHRPAARLREHRARAGVRRRRRRAGVLPRCVGRLGLQVQCHLRRRARRRA